MTMMQQDTVTHLLDRIAEVAPPIIATTTKPGPHCVLSTAVGQMVLAVNGIQSTPFPVEVRIYNDAWRRWKDADYVGGIEEQQRRGAYLISNDPHWAGGTI